MAQTKTTLAAEARAKAGKGAARAVRREGKVPAVIYGDNKEPVLIAINERVLLKELSNKQFFTHLCDLTVEGKTVLVLPRDVQLHPVNDRPEHADFLRVSEKTMIRVNVPVRVTNEKASPGLIKGGVINLVHHEIEVHCKATDIPEEFIMDIGGLELGGSLSIENLKLPKSVVPTLDGDFTIVSVVAPTAMKAEVEAPVAAAAVPAAAAAPAAAAGKAAAPAKAAPAKK
ncbi:MAG: 50S ribosomal protein L25/general stress protein Ctc [Alphaproteobacteria bacterium]|nr:50S ribosomal protein L25/general stress protein Ctc [Alphaproteobacteria bacterium]